MFIFSTWALHLRHIGNSRSDMPDLWRSFIQPCTGFLSSTATKNGESARITTAECRHAGPGWLLVLYAGSITSLLGFSTRRPIFGLMLSVAFGAVMVCYGIAHTAYFSIATGARVAIRFGSDADQGGKLGRAFFQRIVHITYIPVAISSLMMFYGIVAGRSLYPRWMIVFLPVVVYLLKSPVMRISKGHVRELLNDSYDNIALFIFFIISTLVLWNRVDF